jgi:hypothetical protein
MIRELERELRGPILAEVRSLKPPAGQAQAA